MHPVRHTDNETLYKQTHVTSISNWSSNRITPFYYVSLRHEDLPTLLSCWSSSEALWCLQKESPSLRHTMWSGFTDRERNHFSSAGPSGGQANVWNRVKSYCCHYFETKAWVINLPCCRHKAKRITEIQFFGGNCVTGIMCKVHFCPINQANGCWAKLSRLHNRQQGGIVRPRVSPFSFPLVQAKV